MYKNGVEQASDVNAHAPSTMTRTNHYVGKSNWASDAAFNGTLDDLRLYGTALSTTDVAQIYNGGAGEAGAGLLAAGVKRVYTPKDFELNKIMTDIVELVSSESLEAA